MNTSDFQPASMSGVSAGSASPVTGSSRVKRGIAEMLKGGVIMDVVTAEQARIAEDAGAVTAVLAEAAVDDAAVHIEGTAHAANICLGIVDLSAVDLDHLALSVHHRSAAQDGATVHIDRTGCGIDITTDACGLSALHGAAKHIEGTIILNQSEDTIKLAEDKVKEIASGKSESAKGEAEVEYRKLTSAKEALPEANICIISSLVRLTLPSGNNRR